MSVFPLSTPQAQAALDVLAELSGVPTVGAGASEVADMHLPPHAQVDTAARTLTVRQLLPNVLMVEERAAGRSLKCSHALPRSLTALVRPKRAVKWTPARGVFASVIDSQASARGPACCSTPSAADPAAALPRQRDQERLRTALQTDWKRSKLDRFVKDEGERARVFALLHRHYDRVRALPARLCCASGSR